ncbi:MAG: hypothetical protein ACTHL3_08715 [Candidatus Nitrosocosmicus sp.]
MNKTDTSEYNTNNRDDESNLFDEIDLKLLDLFLKNENSKKTAEKSKIPLSTVRRRTKNLLKKGLANQKTEINYEKLRLNKAFLFINTSKKRNSSIVSDLLKIKQLLSVSVTLYNFDLVCIVVFKNEIELYEIISVTKKTPGIKKVLIAKELSVYESNIDTKIEYISPILRSG